MTELREALLDIQNIRRQVAQTTEFRGYGPLTLWSTAVLAAVAGVVQARWIPDPGSQRGAYVGLWLTTAVVCSALIATQMLARARRLHSGLADEMVKLAVMQFLPAGAAGALLPFALLRATPATFGLMPGLWQVLFSVGVFASCRCLPRPMLLVGGWFLVTGLSCVALGDARALSPWTMAGTYAVGMALVAAVHQFAATEKMAA